MRLPEDDVARCLDDGAAALARVGLVVEGFGDDAILVRAVPASLRTCTDEPDVADLVGRILPWLRMTSSAEPSEEALASAMEAIAQTQAPDPAPRLARRWLKELLDQGVALPLIPGLRRWTGAALTGRGRTPR